MYWPLNYPVSGAFEEGNEIVNHTPFYTDAKHLTVFHHEPTWSAATPGLNYLTGVHKPLYNLQIPILRRRIEAA
jgi:hypothetical protein